MSSGEKLLPCPFCGAKAELDTRQGYRAMNGDLGNRIVIYCTRCDADMGRCIEDVPDLRVDEIVELWNARVQKLPQAIASADKSGEWVLLWAEGMKPQPFYWSSAQHRWVQSDDENPIHWSGGPDDCGPTHWMPLARADVFKATLASPLTQPTKAGD